MGINKGIGVPKAQIKQIDRQKKMSKTDKWIVNTAYQNLGDLTQDIQSWADDLSRLKRNGHELQYEKLLRLLLRECRTSVNVCIRAMT